MGMHQVAMEGEQQGLPVQVEAWGGGRCGTRGRTQPGERPELPFLRCKLARVAAGCLEAAQGLREG